MGSRRFIEWGGQKWPLTQLARAHGLSPGTFSYRLSRFGESSTGIQRALCTGLVDRSEAGRRGAMRSPWSGTNRY